MAIFRRDRGGAPEAELELRSLEAQQNPALAAGDITAVQSGEDFLGHIEQMAPKLDEYSNIWGVIDEKVRDALEDEELKSLFDATVMEYQLHIAHDEAPLTRADRRHSQKKVGNNDFRDFIAGPVLFARLKSFGESMSLVEEAQPKGFRDALHMRTDHRDELLKIEGKWLAVVQSSCEVHTPSATEFYLELTDLALSVGADFSKAAKIRRAVLDSVEKYVGKTPTKATEVVDGLLELAESPDHHHIALLQALAADMVQGGDASLAERLLKVSRNVIELGGLATRFLVDKTEEQEGDNPLGFMKTMYDQSHGAKEPNFWQYMTDQKDSWWSELRDEYSSFTDSYVTRNEKALRNLLRSRVVPQHVRPTAYETERIFDRLMTRVVGRPHHEAVAGEEDAKRKAAGMMNKKGGTDTLVLAGNQTEVLRQSLEICKVAPDQTGRGLMFAKNGKVGEYIDKVTGGVDSSRYATDLQQMLDRIAEQPVGQGRVKHKTLKPVKVDGKELPVRRLNPNHVPGMSVGTEAKASRILYVHTNGKLGIVEIFTNHADYDNYVKQNS